MNQIFFNSNHFKAQLYQPKIVIRTWEIVFLARISAERYFIHFDNNKKSLLKLTCDCVKPFSNARKDQQRKTAGICHKFYGRVDKINDLSDMQIAEMKISNSQNDRPAFFMPPSEKNVK